MRRIVIVANPDKPMALRLAKEAQDCFSELGISASLCTDPYTPLDIDHPELAVVLGGDGTVLGGVSRLGSQPPPILAFNVGRLGYLADNPPERLKELIIEAVEGRLQKSCRMMIDASTSFWKGSALNEFVIVSRRSGRLLPLTICVNSEELMDIRGDGIIVATPTGSTAYAMAAGGPVASPDLQAVILAPLCPHQLANRSLVLGPDEVIEIFHHSDSPVELMRDGNYCCDIEPESKTVFRVSNIKTVFLSSTRGKYQVLRDKLGWGWKADWQKRKSARLSFSGR